MVFRSHNHGLEPIWFSHSGEGRFDLAAPDGTCYVAESEVVTLLETWGGLQVVPDYIAAERDSSVLELASTISVADVTSNLAVQYGITSEIFTTTDYRLTQLWASAFRQAGFRGIRYWARHDLAHTAACLALFGPADPTASSVDVDIRAIEHLPDRRDLLDQLERETGITVLAVPPV
ncbi:RES family NAD+ phosphorylase [Mycobacterium hodleri]|nr:RES family NAD+ phosphorylase [Mycolicibacterium hodleri]